MSLKNAKKLKKMLRKSPVSNAWDFIWNSFLSSLLRKWRLLLKLNPIKSRIKENKEIKVKKNIKKISA